ncbi:MAG: hypothetical protein OEZ10_13370 [Gammaproteobacteria bacterium]|nr:hypothetical protein [Gammaproteobacteria bacterium]
MIELDRINSDSFFPRIDIKLSNRSSETALFWQFAIMINHIEIDPTPSLGFWFTVDAERRIDGQTATAHSDTLIIRSTNNGWGSAQDSQLVLLQPVLTALFPDESLRFHGSLKSGETQTTMRLNIDDMDDSDFRTARDTLMAAARDEMEQALPEFYERNSHMTPENGYPEELLFSSYKDYVDEQRAHFYRRWHYRDDDDVKPVIPIDHLNMSWLCSDKRRIMHNGENTIGSLGPAGALYLSETGFLVEESLERSASQPLTLQYCPILEPGMVNHEYAYPFSEKLEPGKHRDLQLFIGCTQSCKMDLVLRFYTHDPEPYEYLVRDLHIWNPMNASGARLFRNGDDIRRTVDDYKGKMKNRKVMEHIKENKKDMLNKVRWLEDRLDNYPFLPLG